MSKKVAIHQCDKLSREYGKMIIAESSDGRSIYSVGDAIPVQFVLQDEYGVTDIDYCPFCGAKLIQESENQ